MRKSARGILNELCNTVEILYALAVIEVLLLGFSAIGYFYMDPGSAGRTIWLLNALGLVVLLGFSAGAVVLCFRR